MAVAATVVGIENLTGQLTWYDHSNALPPRRRGLSFFNFEGVKSDNDDDMGNDIDCGVPTDFFVAL